MESSWSLPGLPYETDLRVLKIQREEIESARSDTVYIKSAALFFCATRQDALNRNEAATVKLVNSLPEGNRKTSTNCMNKQVSFRC